MPIVYALECQANKYYICKTNDLLCRIQDHIQDNGSEWTRLYPPINLVEVKEKADEFDEDKLTIQYMKKFGINHVRGGSFSSVDRSPSDITTLNKMIRSANNTCFNCGQADHFINDCPIKNQSTTRSRQTQKQSTTKVVCYNCGKSGHYASSCYYSSTEESTDSDGW